MTQFSYTPEAWAAMVKNPQDRGEGLRALIEGLGGSLIGVYFCFGDYDGVAIYEMPDNATSMVSVLAATAPGFLRAAKTTVLFSMEEAMGAMARAGETAYAAPEG